MALTETSNTLPEPAMDVAAEDGQPARRLPFTFAKRHGILLQETDDSEIIAVCRPGLDLLILAEVRRFAGAPLKLK
ncbi:MAG: hypothetical protein OEU33_02825, partial [Chromatiales bacterium]|nr:hypothetical protein [Chromatiales bacterium]